VFARNVLHAALLSKLKRVAMVLAALVLLPTGASLAAWQLFTGPDREAAPTVGDVVAVAGEKAKIRSDAYGDPLPEHAVRRFGTLRLRHCGPVTFTPNGKQIVTAGGPALAQVVFWDRATAKESRRLDGDSGILSLHFSPDGTRLAAMRGSVFSNPVWDVDSGKVLFTFRGERGTFTRDGRHLFGVHSSPDGPAIARWEGRLRHRRTVGQHLEEPFNDPEPPVGLGEAQAKPAACRHWPRAYVPKLRGVLRGCDPSVSTLPQDPKGIPDRGVLWVGGFQETKQDSRVGEDEHQSWSRYTSAREKSAGRWGKAGPDASSSRRRSKSASERATSGTAGEGAPFFGSKWS
jgi:hypothetical protein